MIKKSFFRMISIVVAVSVFVVISAGCSTTTANTIQTGPNGKPIITVTQAPGTTPVPSLRPVSTVKPTIIPMTKTEKSVFDKNLDTIYNQVSALKDPKLTKQTINDLMLFLNGKMAGNVNIQTTLSSTLQALLFVDTTQVSKSIQKNTPLKGKRVPIDFEKLIFGNSKNDVAYANVFIQRLKSILDAAYKNDKTALDKAIGDYYALQSSAITYGEAVATTAGKVKFDALNERMKVFVLFNNFTADTVIISYSLTHKTYAGVAGMFKDLATQITNLIKQLRAEYYQ